MRKKKNILCIDDERSVLLALTRIFRKDGVNVISTLTPEEGIAFAHQMKFDLVISDFKMEKMNGVEFLKKFKNLQPSASRIIISGQADERLVDAAIKSGDVHYYMHKPYQIEQLKKVVSEYLDQNMS